MAQCLVSDRRGRHRLPTERANVGEVSDVAVVNASGRAHSIEEYLAHPEVAAKVGHALTAGGS